MEEVAWDRAVEQARAGEAVCDVEALTLDGLVKCAQGKLPNSKVFALFTQLKRLSIASVGLSSLADFPSLPHLERLILSDNRIGGGLEYLVYAGLKSLRELDLSNNKIQAVEDLKPLVKLKLESLDLYECPVTRSADYRAKVFGMMKSLRFLDKMDVTGNERPESDEEEDEEDEEEDVDELNGDGAELEGEERQEGDLQGAAVLEDDEGGEDDDDRDDEGDDNKELEDEEEAGSYQEEVLAAASVRRVVQGHMKNEHGSDEEDVEDEEDDNVDVQDIEDSGEEDVADEDDEDAVVDEEEEDAEEPVSGAHISTGGELGVQENDDEDDNGELGEDEEDDVEDDAVDNGEGEEEVEEEDDEEEEEYGTNYLVQPIGQPEEDEGASDFEPENDDNEDFEDFEDEDLMKESVGLMQNRKRVREETGEKEDRLAKRI